MRIFKLFIVFYFIIFFNSTLFSIAPLKNYTKHNVAYTIHIPGERVSGDYYSPARIFKIPRLSKDNYIIGKVYVKTRSIMELTEGGKSFYGSALQSTLNGLHIEKISKPFESFISHANSNGLNPAIEDKPYDNTLERIFEIKYSAPVDPYDVCKEMMKNPAVEYAVPVFIHQTCEFIPDDPLLGRQYAINQLKLKQAWDITKGDKSVVIAIVDTGTDIDHEDLKANIWTNPNEIPGNGSDDDGNGKVDDVRGWDFVGNITQSEAMAGIWKEDNNPKPLTSGNEHGTHTAGLASAVTNNGKGIAGVGFNCSILPIKCGSDNSSIKGIFRGYEGILYAAKLGAKVINCSWGGPGYDPLSQDIINQALSLGSVVVTASGNDKQNIDYFEQFPALYKNVVTVGSTDSKGLPSYDFTNYGLAVTVYAPGTGIYSTLPQNAYDYRSGTSMSTPIVAGILGLIRSYNKNWTPKQVMHQIRSTADDSLTTVPELKPLYYGRANALKAIQYNSSQFPQFKVPGVEVAKYLIQSGDYLSNYEPVNIRLTLKNYLANVGNLKVTLTALDKYLSIDENTQYISILNTNDSQDVNYSIRLLGNNPWFSGEARILVTFESSDYKDYDLINIPIRIQTQNTFTTTDVYPDWLEPKWYSCSSGGKESFWAVGENAFNAGIFHQIGSSAGKKYGLVTDDSPLTAVSALNSDTAFAGTGPYDNNAEIYKTTNGGSSWSSYSVNPITGFVNSIHFFDNDNGIFLGDPKGTIWGIGYTTNGGKEWKHYKSAPQPVSDETGYAGCAYWLGDYGWFGTSKGRIFRTTNRGGSWNASGVQTGGFIHRIAFMDNQKGMAIYSDSQFSSKKIAISNDGGVKWTTNIYDFTANNLDPVYIYVPPKNDIAVVLFSDGSVFATKDLGKSWFPILSSQTDGTQNGVGFADRFNIRLWNAGLNISYLDFVNIPDNAKRELTLLTDATINFDTVEIGTNVNSAAEIKNTGEAPVNITSAKIIPGSGVEQSEFTFFIAPPSVIQVDKTAKFRVRFTPKAEGERRAKMTILSDAPPGEINIDLIGYGKEPVSVPENLHDNDYEIVVLPNPASDNIKFDIKIGQTSPSIQNNNHPILEIYDNLGRQVHSLVFKDDVFSAGNSVNISLGNFTTGVYYYIFKDGETKIVGIFGVVR